MVSVGSTTAATRSSIASYCAYRSASRLLNFAISLRVISASGPIISERLFGNGVNDDGLRGSTS